MEQMVRCANCGTANPAGQQFCGKCGAKLATEVQQQKVKCPNCGFMNLPGQQFCGSCGARLVAVVHQPTTTPAQPASTAPAQQISTTPTQEVPAVPTQQVPPKAVKPAFPRQQVKATWGLAWGLWWRLLLLSILIGGFLYAIYAIVMILIFHQSFQGLPQIS